MQNYESEIFKDATKGILKLKENPIDHRAKKANKKKRRKKNKAARRSRRKK